MGKAGQQQAGFAGGEVAAVELGAHEYGQLLLAHGFGDELGIGAGGQQVAAQAEVDLGLAQVHGLDGFHHIEPVLGGRRKA